MCSFSTSGGVVSRDTSHFTVLQGYFLHLKKKYFLIYSQIYTENLFLHTLQIFASSQFKSDKNIIIRIFLCWVGGGWVFLRFEIFQGPTWPGAKYSAVGFNIFPSTTLQPNILAILKRFSINILDMFQKNSINIPAIFYTLTYSCNILYIFQQYSRHIQAIFYTYSSNILYIFK